MLIRFDADIVKGEVADVTHSGTVILRDVVLNANTGTTVTPEGLSLRSERGSLLSSAQVVIPTITLTREQVYSLPTYMQVEIRRKADKIRKREGK